MKHIAITGNIGSGKTTVTNIFRQLDIPVYSTDEAAKSLMYKSKDVRNQIIKIVGPESYYKNGKLNREFIAKKIFNDKELLQAINAVVHPAVNRDYLDWRSMQSSAYTVQESALTFESGADLLMDAVIVVYAPKKLLIAQAVSRGSMSKEQVKSRLKKQIGQRKKVKKASYVVNNGLGDLLTEQIHKIHLDLLESN